MATPAVILTNSQKTRVEGMEGWGGGAEMRRRAAMKTKMRLKVVGRRGHSKVRVQLMMGRVSKSKAGSREGRGVEMAGRKKQEVREKVEEKP